MSNNFSSQIFIIISLHGILIYFELALRYSLSSLTNNIYFSLQEERRSLARAAIATSQETPFGLYGPPAAYAPGYF